MAAAPAAAGTETRVFQGNVAHVYYQSNADPGTCVAITFYRWADVPGTTNASVSYIYKGVQPYTEGKSAPFDDAYADGPKAFPAPAGQHQLYMGYASGGGSPRDCASDQAAIQSRSGYAATAQVTLTIDKSKTAGCAAAKQKLAKQKAAVRKLAKKVKNASSKKRKKKLKKKLSAAKKKQKTLTKGASAAC